MSRKHRFALLVLLLIAAVPTSQIASQARTIHWTPTTDIRVMTINLRTSRLSLMDFPNIWYFRRFLVAKVIQREQPEIVAPRPAVCLDAGRCFVQACPLDDRVMRGTEHRPERLRPRHRSILRRGDGNRIDKACRKKPLAPLRLVSLTWWWNALAPRLCILWKWRHRACPLRQIARGG